MSDTSARVQAAAIVVLASLAAYDDLHDEMFALCTQPLVSKWLASRDSKVREALAQLLATWMSIAPESTSVDDGLTLTNAWVTSAVKCAPPMNKPTTTERDACRPFLVRELDALDAARVVICLGTFGYDAAMNFFGVRPTPKFGHGVEVPVTAADGRALTVICSYHVSQQNTFTGRLTEDMLDSVFNRARELAGC